MHILWKSLAYVALLLVPTSFVQAEGPLPKFAFQAVVLEGKDLRFAPSKELERASLVKMEGRVDKPLGKYYLYYSPHKHVGVSLAYSDSIEGPWIEYQGNPIVQDAAIPDVRWIEETGKFHLWAHKKNKQTEMWTSSDGLHFDYHSVSIAASEIGTRNATYTRAYEFPLERYKSKYIMLYSGFIVERGIRCIWLAHSRDGEHWVQEETPLVEPIDAENNDIYGPSLFQWQGKNYIVYQDHTAYRGGNVKYVEIDSQLRSIGDKGKRHLLVEPVADSPIDNRYRECEVYRNGDTLYLFASGGDEPRCIIYATAQIQNSTNSEEPGSSEAKRVPVEADQEHPNRISKVDASDQIVMKILRPKLKGEQVSPTWIELNYLIIDARHPNGIEKLQLWKPGAKKAERSFTAADRHVSGYFFYKRRFKSDETRDYKIYYWPGGTDPSMDPPHRSDTTFTLEYRDPMPKIPNYLGFTNLNDGSVIAANDSSNPNDLTYIYLDCMDSSGTWRKGNWEKAKHVGYRDDDGIQWVELVIRGPNGETVLRNDTALIFDADQRYHGPYWGEPVDSTRTKPPEESWSKGEEWRPIEGFGLYEFAVRLKPGSYQLTIRAKNNVDKLITGPTISITAKGHK
ncbi:hypothetical protein Pan97_28830 [Bremerella volcania]|uniref:Glycosyl hydrolases family 43 n=1 Tax=Bremerella volcania TaxID=2527984 RepID=A0A518C9E4_9BACT|nr:family 43 glycosylhydrolase [Bremerella volcania]QDU75841.1 hypothetical protein Pan97_28830 [Bremerella volcania]